LAVSLDYLLEALEKLDSLDRPLRIISRTFYRRICQPVLSRSMEANTCSIDETSHCLMLSPSENKKDAQNVIDCLSLIFIFLHTHFPERLGSAIGTTLSKELIGVLMRDWLTPSIPLSLLDLRQSYNIQTTVRELAALMMSYSWPGQNELTAWVGRVPHTWLEKRRTSALDAVRRALKARRGPDREVERVERQNISRQDEAFAQNAVEDWNATWTEEEPRMPAASISTANEEEEDLSGWDFDEDAENNGSSVPSPSKANGDVEDTSDAWGWDEDKADDTRPEDSRSRPGRAHPAPTNGSTEDREVTLTETYTITDIPHYLLDIITCEVQDAEKMKTPEFASLESISAPAGLISISNLVLAMFRAIAPAYYNSSISTGNMHLYNDGVYVVEKLRDLAKDMSLTQLRKDCDVLEKFARSAYAREMEVQRTVLGDLLDGAQGFVNCTRFPYSAECENSVSSTTDRLRAVHRDWSSILSRSALLQSIGSLLSSVIEKIVKDVEDMEDISEAESQRLTTFCGQISALEDLFVSERRASGERADAEAIPLTAVYVPNWLRFQYLSNILESSLVDIKYLWTEGELSLEFTADEVIELIEALFAESSHRRNAIAEIRRSRL
jgi:protein transport protein DSL1/ZW10